MDVHADAVAQAMPEGLPVSPLLDDPSGRGVGLRAGVPGPQSPDARGLGGHHQPVAAPVLGVRLPEEDGAAVVVAVALVGRAEVKGDRDRRLQGDLQHLLPVGEVEGIVGTHVVEGGDEGVGVRAVTLELVVHLGDEVQAGHAVTQAGQGGLVGRLGDGPGLAQDGDLLRRLDAAQGHDQGRGQLETGPGQEPLQVDQGLGPGPILQGYLGSLLDPQTGQGVPGQLNRVPGIGQDANASAGQGAQVELGQHAGQGEDGRALLGDPGAGEPLPRVEGVAEVGLLPGEAGQVVEAGGDGQEEEIHPLLCHAGLDGVQSFGVVDHGDGVLGGWVVGHWMVGRLAAVVTLAPGRLSSPGRHLRSRGSRASRMPSPRKLKAMTTVKMARPGKAAIHHWSK